MQTISAVWSEVRDCGPLCEHCNFNIDTMIVATTKVELTKSDATVFAAPIQPEINSFSR